MRIFSLVLFLALSLFAAKYAKPVSHYNVSGSVVDVMVHKGLIYCSTDASGVDIIDLKSKKNNQAD